jgi:hypothetical protein
MPDRFVALRVQGPFQLEALQRYVRRVFVPAEVGQVHVVIARHHPAVPHWTEEGAAGDEEFLAAAPRPLHQLAGLVQRLVDQVGALAVKVPRDPPPLVDDLRHPGAGLLERELVR